ncbi:hypothetical protein BJX61DRAFT_501484 [Aspergillus egyptiacus]|nr:hypothetical protein BJX61DRAFT_501484 [Aspergillus egyptiacus]
MDAASQGDAALAKSDFASAIQHYTRALVEHPRAPAYYIKRSTAYVRLKPADGGPNVQGALQDAENGLVLARERAKRDLILSSQMRRAVALYHLERYGDAKFLFELLASKVVGNKDDKVDEDAQKADKLKTAMNTSKAAKEKNLSVEVPMWLMKVRGKLNGLSEEDGRRKVTVEEFPDSVKLPSVAELKEQLESLKNGKIVGGEVSRDASSAEEKTKSEPAATEAPKESKAPVASSPEKIRHEWYQSSDSVVVTLYAKGIKKESVDAELKSNSVSVQFPLPSGSEYAFTLDPLYASIDESNSKITTYATKIELVLRKQTPGQKWSGLESSSTDIKPTTTTTSIATPSASASAPSYPTSSRHGAKDWDKLASTLTAKKPKDPKTKAHSHSHDGDKCIQDHKTEGKDHDAAESDNEGSVDSDYGADPVDGFFKKLYAGADDDTRRAMVKSFVESNGTSLSTNWSEVGKGKVNPYQAKD